MQSVRIMGILNVTPDSFADGGRHQSIDKALAQAELMVSQGADIIDIGGESTRPQAQIVSEKEEINRVIPVIETIRQQSSVTISIDSYKPVVMQKAVKAGANIINDVYALTQPNALAMAADLNVDICLMHMQNTPQTMQTQPQYKNVVSQVYDFLAQRIDACQQQGIKKKRLMIDPGFGFGKTYAHNIALLKNLSVFKTLKLPLLVGLSRKSMIATMVKQASEQRIIGSVSAAILAVQQGADIVRVHDVLATKQALNVLASVQ